MEACLCHRNLYVTDARPPSSLYQRQPTIPYHRALRQHKLILHFFTSSVNSPSLSPPSLSLPPCSTFHWLYEDPAYRCKHGLWPLHSGGLDAGGGWKENNRSKQKQMVIEV